MARKKCKCPPAGAPEWMVTYGDMMTLLLCFFVLIVSFSEIKKEDEFKAVVEEIQKAFGLKGGGGKMPTPEDPRLSIIERLDAIRLNNNTITARANTDDPGIEGREATVTRVREGLLYTVGGPVTFEPGSAELSDRTRAQPQQIVEQVRGHNNLIELRGHAAALELEGADSAYGDLWSLSHARAKAAMDFLTSEEVGLRPERFRLIANADREPLEQRAYSAAQDKPNRRVELIESEALVEDFTKPQARSSR